MKAIERLNKFIEVKGYTPAAFEKACGISNGYIGGQLRTKGSVGSDILEKIAEIYPELNLVWVITGRGYMITNPPKTSKEDELANQRLEEEQAKYNTISKAGKLIEEALVILKSVSAAKRGSGRKRKG